MVDLSCDTTQRSPFQGLQNFGRLWHIIPQILLEATSCSSCVSNPFFLPCTSHFSCRKSYIFIGQRTSHGNCSGLSLAVSILYKERKTYWQRQGNHNKISRYQCPNSEIPATSLLQITVTLARKKGSHFRMALLTCQIFSWENGQVNEFLSISSRLRRYKTLCIRWFGKLRSEHNRALWRSREPGTVRNLLPLMSHCHLGHSQINATSFCYSDKSTPKPIWISSEVYTKP
jgi:hypothetical protein